MKGIMIQLRQFTSIYFVAVITWPELPSARLAADRRPDGSLMVSAFFGNRSSTIRQ
jgi:hypothetical protein